MKSQKLTILTLLFFLASIALITLPTAKYALGANISYFNVTLTITADTACNVTDISVQTDNPAEGSTTTITIYFNVTDPENDLAFGNMYVNITYGSTIRQADSCSSYSAWDNAPTRGVQCVTTASTHLQYYDNPGNWNLTAYCEDNVGTGSNVSTLTNGFTYGQLYAMKLESTDINFTVASAGTNDVGSSTDPLVVNNTGNMAFANVNITGYELVGPSSSIIGAGNFSVNATNDDQSGVAMVNNTPVTITSATLATQRTTGTQNMWFYVDVPFGIASGQYNTTSQWIVEVYN